MIIVGISASHDASACVLVDGKLEIAVQLERVSRVKHDGLPFLSSDKAVKYCLDALKISRSQVDIYAFNSLLAEPNYVGLCMPTHDSSFDLFDPFSKKSLFVSHHLCHALGAYYSSGYDGATAIVIDGSGGATIDGGDLVLDGPAFQKYIESSEWLVKSRPVHVLSSYNFNGRDWALKRREFAPTFDHRVGSSSLGETYAAVSNYIFGSWQDSGKLMGLAPYGNPNYFNDGQSLLEPDQCGNLNFGSLWKNRLRTALGQRGHYKQHADLAARIQTDLEIALLQRFEQALIGSPSKNVVYSGGVALNCVANDKIIKRFSDSNFYIMPSAHDAGIAIGAAAAAYYKFAGNVTFCRQKNDFLGRTYSDTEISDAIDEFSPFLVKERYSHELMVDKLRQGCVVGWFEGGSEFGPRSLGHRSIFADPTNSEIWNFINKHVKYREEFRPFAPVVVEEFASTAFELEEASEYMLRAVPVREAYRSKLPAVTHVDGSARVQTVSKLSVPNVYDLLVCFGKETGLPILVNTSLNVKGEPIVETPREALLMLLSTNLHAVAMEGWLLTPIDPPKACEISDAHFSLPISAEMKTIVKWGTKVHLLDAKAQGSRELILTENVARTIDLLNQGSSFGEAVKTYDAAEQEKLATVIISFVKLRLLLVRRNDLPS